MARISKPQADTFRQQVAARLRWAIAARDRLTRLGYTPADPLYRAVEQTADALQELHVASHYEGCPSGTGRRA